MSTAVSPGTASQPAPCCYQPLVIVLASVCAGVVADRYFSLSAGAWWLAALVAWIVWWLLWRNGKQRWAVPLLLAALAAAGAAWHHCCWHLFDADELGLFARYNGQPVCLEGRALHGARRLPASASNPMRTIPTGDRSRVEIECEAIRDGQQWRHAAGRFTLLVDGHLLGVQAGDRVRVFGQLVIIRPPLNPGEFDFAHFSRADRRLCLVRSEVPECVSRLQAATAWNGRRLIDHLRGQGDAMLWRYLSPQNAGLAAAMFLGIREELDDDQRQAFMETGTIHLLVVSGLNVGILAMFLFAALRVGLLGRRSALVAVVAVSVLYATVTDLQPPVVRATIMVLIVCAALASGREALAWNALAAAALVVILLNPAELFRAGTQLSFLSVAVLIWLAQYFAQRPPLDPVDRLVAETRPWGIRVLKRTMAIAGRAVLTSTAIWLVVMPLVMARFHLLSPAAVILGPILALPVALAMLAGFGLLALGWLFPPAAAVCGLICNANLELLDRCIDVARPMPGSHFWVSGPDDWWLSVFYGGLALWSIAGRYRPPRRWCLALFAAWAAVGFASARVLHADDQQLRATFVSVGHGCSVVLELPGGQTMLYDAGRLGSPVVAAQSISGYLWSRGITHLDAVVISHADADHYNALPELLRRFSVGPIYVSPLMFEDPSGAVAALAAALEREGVAVRETWSGDRLRTNGPCQIEVLHPPRQGVLGSDNANSIVLAIELAGRRILLTGDLEPPGLYDLLSEEPLDCDVLLAPHHGSVFSDPPGMARWSSPEWVVISGADATSAEAVAATYRSRGCQVLHTAVHGAVQVIISGREMTVETWRDGTDPRPH